MVHPTTSTRDISFNTSSVSDMKLKRIMAKNLHGHQPDFPNKR
ncbi:hypothetical protein V1478_005439 [Vespula squamosa]|uniref:Uncharacterized protein n=1 Tax=Vespula squamosa TaxID=30214 RepID=A0ABD2BE45_VESSQ